MQDLARTMNTFEQQTEIHNNNIKRRGLVRDVTNSHGFVNDYVLSEEYDTNEQYLRAIENNYRLVVSFLQNYNVQVIKHIFGQSFDVMSSNVPKYTKLEIIDKNW